MYHHEQILDGKLYYQTTPHGKWFLVDYTKLLDRLIEAQNKLVELKEEVDSLKEQVQFQSDISSVGDYNG